MESSTFKIALIQMKMQEEKVDNIQKAKEMLTEAAEAGAQVLVLPEAFTCNYSRFPSGDNAEPIDDFETNDKATAAKMLSQVAADHSVYIIGGSMAERRDDDIIYNTCPCFDKQGKLVAKYTKCHLFDVEIPGKVSIKESKFYAKGEEFVTFDTEFCKFGIGV